MSLNTKKFLQSKSKRGATTSNTKKPNFLSAREYSNGMDVSESMAPIANIANDYSAFNEDNTGNSLIRNMMPDDDDDSQPINLDLNSLNSPEKGALLFNRAQPPAKTARAAFIADEPREPVAALKSSRSTR